MLIRGEKSNDKNGMEMFPQWVNTTTLGRFFIALWITEERERRRMLEMDESGQTSKKMPDTVDSSINQCSKIQSQNVRGRFLHILGGSHRFGGFFLGVRSSWVPLGCTEIELQHSVQFQCSWILLDRGSDSLWILGWDLRMFELLWAVEFHWTALNRCCSTRSISSAVEFHWTVVQILYGFLDGIWGCLSYSEQLNSTGLLWTSAAALGAGSVQLNSTELSAVQVLYGFLDWIWGCLRMFELFWTVEFHWTVLDQCCNTWCIFSAVRFHWTALSSGEKAGNASLCTSDDTG